TKHARPKINQYSQPCQYCSVHAGRKMTSARKSWNFASPTTTRLVRSSITNLIARRIVVDALNPSAHVAARIVRLLIAPLAHQLFEFGVLAVRHDDFHRDVEIARTGLGRQAFALEAEGAAARGVRRDRKLDRA